MRSEHAAASATELALACRSGDAQAWDLLLDRYERLVFAIAVREGLSNEDAADVTQTTFEALLTQLDRIRDDERIAFWLMTVARRQAWRVRDDRIRQRADETVTTTGDGSTVDPISDHNTVMWVYQGLSKLDGVCRELITALYFDPESPSYAEVASRFGRPVGSIGPTRARCLTKLRTLLGEVSWND
ncbi:MAG: sigma-70 family RNA polymerase sigma factor [Acidimicrobiales bacterium]